VSDDLKRWFQGVQNYMTLAGQTARGAVTPPFYWRDTVDELDQLGVGSLTVVLLTGTFTGMVLALQSGVTMQQFGARSAVGRLVSASVVKELGPVLTALMVTGRVGSGIAAELGAMKVTDQISALRALGVDPVRKLVVPRVIAATMALPLLTVISDGAAMLGAAIISILSLHIAVGTYWINVVHGLYMRDIYMGLVKPVIFAVTIVTIACHIGLSTTGGTRGVGRSTTRAVVLGSIAVLAVDFFVTKVLIALFY
jgi:phospholipid/cholesterol/gamma-HCH transport system permease protein